MGAVPRRQRVGGIAGATREVLQRVAVVGSTFDTDEFVALSALSEEDAFDRLDQSLPPAIIEPASAGLPLPPSGWCATPCSTTCLPTATQIHRDAAID